MKIALVNQWYPPEDWGGVPVYVHALAAGLCGIGHEVTVITSTLSASLVNTECIEDGIRVLRIKRPLWPWFVSRTPVVGRHATSLRLLYYNLRLLPVLRHTVQRLRLDIIEYADVNGEGSSHGLGLREVPYSPASNTSLCRRTVLHESRDFILLSSHRLGGKTCDQKGECIDLA